MRLPREVVDCLFLEILKTQAGLALDTLLWLVLLLPLLSHDDKLDKNSHPKSNLLPGVYVLYHLLSEHGGHPSPQRIRQRINLVKDIICILKIPSTSSGHTLFFSVREASE